MKEIQSHNNRSAKLIKKLKEKKHRDIEGMYVIEGPNLLVEALKNKEDIVLIGVDSTGRNIMEGISGIPEEKMISFSSEVFRTLAETVTPQNVLTVIRKRDKNYQGFNDRCNKIRYIVLDSLQDPGNVGTIIRTAEAADFTGIISVKGTADIYSPKVVRAAAGSHFRIDIIEFLTSQEAIDFLEETNTELYACDSRGDTLYTEADLRDNIAIVVGNEGNGLSKNFAERSNTIKIPMKEKTESLNVAVAAGIVIYESDRQRRISRDRKEGISI